MPLQISRADLAPLATPYVGLGLPTVYLKIDKVIFDLRQDTLDYEFSAYATLAAMTAGGTASVPVPELLGLNTIKVGLSGVEQNGGQLAICYAHLKGLLAAVVGAPYTVTDI